MVRKVFCICLLIGMLGITGCGNQTIIDDRQQTVNMKEDSKKQVIVWHTYSEEETKVFENVVIPLFEKEHPDIDIKPVRQAYNEQLKSAMISRASSNKPPDIIRMDIAWLPMFAHLDLLYPVSKFNDFGKVKQSLYEEPLQSNFYNGMYYGLPLNTNTKVSIYNRTLLEEAGLTEPPKTMKELIDLVEKKGYQIGISGTSTWEILPYFYGLGGMLTDPTYSHVKGYLDSKASADALTQLLTLYEKGLLTKKLLEGNAETWHGIQDGTYFMIDEGPWFYSIQSAEDLYRIKRLTVSSPFPVTNGQGSILGGENLVITKGTKELDAAWTFVKWMTEKKPQSLMLETGLIPTNKNVEFTGLYDKYPYYETYVKGIDQSFLRPPIAQWNQIDELFAHYIKLIFSGSLPVETALKEAAEKMEAILQQ